MKKSDKYNKKISRVLKTAEKNLQKIAIERDETSESDKIPAEVIFAKRSERRYEQSGALDAARVAAGLSVAEMARLFGMPYRTMQNYLIGKNIPPVWVERLMLQKISDLCEGKIEIPDAPPVYIGYLRKNPHQIESEIYPMLAYFETFTHNIASASKSEDIFECYLLFLKKFFPKKAEILLSASSED